MTPLRKLGAALLIAAGMAVSAGSAMAQNIVQVATEAGRFKTLLTAAKAAGLVPALSGRGPLTVFAPTDAAFARLPKGTVENLLRPGNRAQLARILKYHVVKGRVPAAAIKPGRSHVPTLAGRSLRVVKHGAVRVNDARVVQADIRASNGIIHVVNRVLLPR